MTRNRAVLQAVIAGMAILVLGSGCATIRRAREAQDPAKVPAGERTVTAAEAGLKDGTALTLERAQEIALKYQPAVVVAEQNLAVAESKAKDALAAYFPVINATASYTYSDNEGNYNPDANPASSLSGLSGMSGTSGTSAGGGERNNFSAGLSLDQLLFDFGRTSASVREANEAVIAARERRCEARIGAVYDVRKAFYALGQAQALVAAAEENEKQFQLVFDQTSLQREVGRMTGYEVTKAQVDWSNALSQRLNAENAVLTGRAALNQAMGLAESPAYAIVEPAMPEAAVQLSDAMDRARKHNPELQALAAEVKLASAGVDYSIADLFPKLTLSGQLAWRGAELPLTWAWQLGPMIAQSVFDGFRNLNAVDQSAAQLRSARARQADQEQKIYLQLSQAVASLENADKHLEATGQALAEAQQGRDQAHERYQVGRGSLLELTDAQLSLTRARADDIQARYDRRNALALIDSIIGEECP